jgi:hypothetical protein
MIFRKRILAPLVAAAPLAAAAALTVPGLSLRSPCRKRSG